MDGATEPHRFSADSLVGLAALDPPMRLRKRPFGHGASVHRPADARGCRIRHEDETPMKIHIPGALIGGLPPLRSLV